MAKGRRRAAAKDYSRFLILYGGGADSTHFIESEPSARYLLHFESRNREKTSLVIANARTLGRHLNIISLFEDGSNDGEIDQIHALTDTLMALRGCIRAASHGMDGIVLGFNRDDLGIDTDAVLSIMRRSEPEFKILMPLRKRSASSIRLKMSKSSLPYISCMTGRQCGQCPKCLRGY